MVLRALHALLGLLALELVAGGASVVFRVVVVASCILQIDSVYD